jgi:hypothetical protein
MICTVFGLRTFLTSQRILLYPSLTHYKALVKDKGTLQGTSKYFWHVYLVLSLQELRVTAWYCTAQYTSTGCNCMGSFVLLVAIAWDLLFYWLQLREIFCGKTATSAQEERINGFITNY